MRHLKKIKKKKDFFLLFLPTLRFRFLIWEFGCHSLAKLSFLMVIMDFLIEAPLKTIIGVIEEWTSFIRERREEVVSVPM